jgi:hypothetical protein
MLDAYWQTLVGDCDKDHFEKLQKQFYDFDRNTKRFRMLHWTGVQNWRKTYIAASYAMLTVSAMSDTMRGWLCDVGVHGQDGSRGDREEDDQDSEGVYWSDGRRCSAGRFGRVYQGRRNAFGAAPCWRCIYPWRYGRLTLKPECMENCVDIIK